MACALIGLASNVSAQTDVTSTYFTDATFDSETAATANVSGSKAGNYASMTNWTVTNTGDTSNSWSCSAVMSYGTSYTFNSVSVPSTGPNSETDGNTLAISMGWAGAVKFEQAAKASLPAGVYTLTCYTYNNNTSATQITYNFGFVTSSSTEYLGTVSSIASGSWVEQSYEFALSEETAGTFTMTAKAVSGGSGANAKFFVDGISLTYSNSVSPTAVALSSTELALTVGGTSTLTVTYTPEGANTDTDITWTSSDETVATVADGVVTAVGPGSATITATTANSLEATCAVTVTDVTAADAPSFYSEIAEGDFYIMNAATGTFLGGANSWGTQASLLEHGIPFTVALGDGVYTLDSHTYNSSTAHYFSGTYVDGTSTNLYITSLGSGKYSISTADGSAYVTANTSTTVVANTAATANSVLAQWYFISKDDLESSLANATSTNPVDATFYIGDPNFSRNHIASVYYYGTTTLYGSDTYPWEVGSLTNYNLKGGNNDNFCGESYRAAGTITQTLSVENGKYKVLCQGFRRQDSGSDESYLIANDEQVALSVFNGNSEGTTASMAGASTSFTADLYQNELDVYVTDGSLTVGIQNVAGNWTCFDNFELYYYGATIGGEAEALPETAMTADSWYYFDIAVAGNYNLTAGSDIANIVYTTDGTILIENESTVTDNFSGTESVALTAGRYYVKSSSAQTFTVEAAGYAYSVGDATLSVADGAYTQSQTFTVTFASAATSDPDASPALVENSTATVNGTEVELTAVTNGFSLDLGTLTAATDYVISIPASVYGYADESMNEAISVTVHTPVVFDGVYCLYDATNKLFLGRGNAWGTEAAADKYGIPFNLATSSSNVSSIEFVDWSDVYLFLTGTAVYTDNASTGWNLVATTDGYYLMTSDGTYYTTHASGDYGEYVYATTDEASATVWTLKTVAERDAIIAAYPTDNITNVISAAGISTTAANFETYLSENYGELDWTSKIGTPTFSGSVGDWTWTSIRSQDNQPAYGTNYAEVWCATGYYSQTIEASNLPAGIYKVTVDGYERRATTATSTALGAAGYNVVSSFMSANDEQVRLTDWYDMSSQPGSTTAAVTAFTNGEATNTLYVYLDGSTDLTLIVKKPNYIYDCWMIFNNFTLTRYAEAEAVTIAETTDYTPAYTYANVTLNRTIKADTWNTFVVPFDITNAELTTAFGDDVAVAEYSDAGDSEDAVTVTFTTMDTPAITANVPVLLKTSTAKANTDDVVFSGKVIDTATPTLEGTYFDFVGSYDASTTIAEGDYYLSTNMLYKSTGLGSTIAGTRAYLQAKSTEARIANFSIDGEGGTTTGINVVEMAKDGEAVYNLNGQKMENQNLRKGLYIINGRKVVK